MLKHVTPLRLGLVVMALCIPLFSPLLAMMAVPIFSTKGIFLAASVHKLGLTGLLVGEVANLPSETLQNKNRQAMQFRADAQKIRDELLDEKVVLTQDEFIKKSDAMKVLESRANLAAEFTGEDEIRRQGGLGNTGLTQIAGPENAQPDRLERRMSMPKRIEQLAEKIIGEFGDVRSFMEVAIAGTSPVQSSAQQALIAEAKTLTRAIIGTAGDISGGEFLLPLTQVQSIFTLSNVQQGIMQRARSYNVPGRSLRIPYLIQDDTNASTTLNRPMAGQIANVTIVGEGSTKPTRTPSFGQRLLTIYKYAAITQIGDETLMDDFTGELPADVVNAVGQQALNKVNEDCTFDGSGTSEPTAALLTGAAHTIAFTRTTTGDIKTTDVFGMYSRHTHGPNSYWMASRRTVEKLFAMSLTSSSMVTFIQSLNVAPQMMLLGYPVMLTDLLPTLGSAGDIALVNPDFYAFALRQALTVESSRDYAFVNDLTTYRFIVRAGGIPINTGKYAYKYAGTQGVDEHSPFVYLSA